MVRPVCAQGGHSRDPLGCGRYDAPPNLSQYSDREVRLILKSAADLQRREDPAGEKSGGLTLAELEQVAAEVGLDPILIRRAAAHLDGLGAPSERNAFLGSPTEIVIERVVDVAIDAAHFDDLLNVTRAVTREVGEVSTVGRQFGWKGRLDGAKTEVSVSAGDRRTTLRVRVELDELAVGHFMLKGMLFGVGGGFVGTVVAATVMGPFSLVVAAGMLGSGYVWARGALRVAAARYGVRAGELLDALARQVGESAGERTP